MSVVGSIGGIPPIGEIASASAGKAGGAGASFGAELAGAVERVEQNIAGSREVAEGMLRGEPVDLHKVALRAQEAQMSFELFLQVRNKIIQGYQEIMRLQV